MEGLLGSQGYINSKINIEGEVKVLESCIEHLVLLIWGRYLLEILGAQLIELVLLRKFM